MTSFTNYWRNETWDKNAHREGEPLSRLSGNEFRSRGVKRNDDVFVVTVKKGKLFVLARTTVDKYVSQAEIERIVQRKVWDADQHILGVNGTPMRFARQVPDEIVANLRFGDNKPLKFKSPGVLDHQTLRSPVRKLTQKSAALLDSIVEQEVGNTIDNAQKLEITAIDDDTGYEEGTLSQRLILHRQREQRARKDKIAEVIHRTGRLVCEVQGCGFDFSKTYGKLGEGYAQVHHLKPLGSQDSQVHTKLTDLAIVCANCHCMIHIGGDCRPLKGLIPKPKTRYSRGR